MSVKRFPFSDKLFYLMKEKDRKEKAVSTFPEKFMTPLAFHEKMLDKRRGFQGTNCVRRPT
jgi:hypothetical protein